MWTAPGYEPERPQPPAETGRRLATFPRGDREELRVTLAEYKGRPYLALRVWAEGDGGGWWPVRGKGVSVRISEAGKLAEALAAVAGAAQGRSSGAQPRGQRPARQGSHGEAAGARDGPYQLEPSPRQGGAPGRPGGASREFHGKSLPPPDPGRGGFDEFGGAGEG
jgi:hypothetical protein